MKKIISAVLCLAMIVSTFCFTAFADDSIKIVINGEKKTFDQMPVLINDRTLVPMRGIFESLGATVSWNDATQTATGVLGDKTVSLSIGDKNAKVNGQTVVLDVPAQLISDRTMVPVRFISESLGASVDWEDTTQTVIIKMGSQSANANSDIIFYEGFEGGTDGAKLSDSTGTSAANGNVPTYSSTAKTGSKSIKVVFGTSDAKSNLGCKLFVPQSVQSVLKDGETYTLSAYINFNLASGSSGQFNIKTLNGKGASTVANGKSQDVKNGEWTLITNTFKYEKSKYSDGLNIRIDTLEIGTGSYYFVDDVKISKGDKVLDGTAQGTETPVTPVTPSNPQTPVITGNEIYSLDFDSLTGAAESDIDASIGVGAANGSVPKIEKTTVKSGTTSVKVESYNKATTNIGCKFFIPASLQGAFTDGETYTISAYVYLVTPSTPSAKFNVKTLNGTGALAVSNGKPQEVKKGEWVQISNTFKYEKSKYTEGSINIRIDTGEIESGSYYFVDDVKVTKGAAATAASSLSASLGDYTVLAEKIADGHRPIPTSFSSGKGFDDLLYFGDSEKKDNETLAKDLPEGKTVVDDSLILDKKYQKDYEYGNVSEVSVSGMPFDKAIRVTVSKVPKVSPYSFQLDFGTPLAGKGKTGDKMLLKIYMRTVSGGDGEAQSGKIQAIIEENGGVYEKAVQMDLTAQSDWEIFYAPFEYDEKFTRATLRLGYYEQVVEIGGYEIINYENKTTIDKMPANAGNTSILKGASWRKEAWDRIEKIRKGDFTVIVTDENGKVIPNANVSFDMYEHEFQFGTAVNEGIFTNEKYQRALQENFNTIVLENNHKPRLYEENPNVADNMVRLAKDLGIKNVRGHCLVWDKAWQDSGMNSSTTDNLNEIIKSGDKSALEAELKRQIETILTKNKGVLTDWDVLNEAQRKDMRYLSDNGHDISDYGMSLIKKIYSWARAADPKIKLYYNDYIATQDIVKFTKKLIDAGVDFDGVGMQTHNDTPRDIPAQLKLWDAIGGLGKSVKITEFDMNNTDLDLQANFTRDMLIASFSHEAVDGFIMWGFAGSAYVLYDYKVETEKPALSVWQDLIYNKWMTNESTLTQNDGASRIRGFYGDYDITVTANGKTVKQTAHFYKNSNNVLKITIK